MVIFLLIFFGLIFLFFGAELLVKYSSHLAAALGIPSIIIGLTVVAFGTSTPELIVSIFASISGKTDIAVGNVVGSNIFNVLFILGASAVVCPLVVHRQIVRIDVPIMVAASLLVWWAASYKKISFFVGVLFLIAIVIYTLFLIYQAKKTSTSGEFEKEYGKKRPISSKGIFLDIFLILVSLVVLVIGSSWLVDGSVQLAKLMGVSDLVISLTIVAAGTSLPELATSVLAAFRGERDIAVGNIVGSNIYNIFGILGLSAILAPDGLPVPETALNFDIPIMVAVALACLPIFFSGHKIYRWEGALFVAYYVAYIALLIMGSVDHPWYGSFSSAMMFFVIPLTLLIILIELINYCKRVRRNN